MLDTFHIQSSRSGTPYSAFLTSVALHEMQCERKASLSQLLYGILRLLEIRLPKEMPKMPKIMASLRSVFIINT